jgi:hypothetical protein
VALLSLLLLELVGSLIRLMIQLLNNSEAAMSITVKFQITGLE